MNEGGTAGFTPIPSISRTYTPPGIKKSFFIFAVTKKMLLLQQELWINLRLIATTEKNAKAIALTFYSIHSINPEIIVKPDSTMMSILHCGFINI